MLASGVKAIVTIEITKGVRMSQRSQSNSQNAYASILFVLSFGLMLSDFMSRSVLNGVFPSLRLQWSLGDGQLGTLSGIVAAMVGVLVLPLSLAADKFGRVKSIVVMSLIWSLATMACGLATGYWQLLIARMFVGVGEAAYGSVGVAILFSLFPLKRHATINGAFLAGAFLGAVLGIALGSNIAATFGWRWAFHAMALFGFVLAIGYAAVAGLARIEATRSRNSASLALSKELFRRLRVALLSSPILLSTYVGSGLQLFVASAFMAWMPSYLHRAYNFEMARAGSAAAIFIFISGVGMVTCSIAADHAGRRGRHHSVSLGAAYCLACFAALSAAFFFEPGAYQLFLLGVGMFFATGVSGLSGAVVAGRSEAAIHGTALGILTLANNLIGLAPGPVLTGLLADRFGLPFALRIGSLASLGAAAAFLVCARQYRIARADSEALQRQG